MGPPGSLKSIPNYPPSPIQRLRLCRGGNFADRRQRGQRLRHCRGDNFADREVLQMDDFDFAGVTTSQTGGIVGNNNQTGKFYGWTTSTLQR